MWRELGGVSTLLHTQCCLLPPPPPPHTHTHTHFTKKHHKHCSLACSSTEVVGVGWLRIMNRICPESREVYQCPQVFPQAPQQAALPPNLESVTEFLHQQSHFSETVCSAPAVFKLITDSLLASWNTNFLKDKSHSGGAIHINVFLLRSTSQLLETLKGINVLILRLWVSLSSAQKASSYTWANVTAPPKGLQCISTRSLP